MSATTRVLITLCLLAACGAASAAHITDKLVVGLYAQPAEEGSPLQLLSSGTPLEVLQRKAGFSEVRLADDTRGWVASSYVTEEKPAKVMLLEAQAKLRLMGIELAALREGQAAQAGEARPPVSPPPSAREAQLRQALDAAATRTAELESQLAGRPLAEQAQRELEVLRGRVRQVLDLLVEAEGLEVKRAEPVAQGLVTRYQTWIVGLAALLVGFGAGVAVIDYRIRRRYGGFRI